MLPSDNASSVPASCALASSRSRNRLRRFVLLEQKPALLNLDDRRQLGRRDRLHQTPSPDHVLPWPRRTRLSCDATCPSRNARWRPVADRPNRFRPSGRTPVIRSRDRGLLPPWRKRPPPCAIGDRHLATCVREPGTGTLPTVPGESRHRGIPGPPTAPPALPGSQRLAVEAVDG